MANLWADLPIGRVVRLVGAGSAALELSLTPLPADAPAVITYRPTPHRSRVGVVSALLAELETVAWGLFPAWLPAAREISGPGGSGVAAVRALAQRLGPSAAHFGPFLADLAEAALRAGLDPVCGRHPAAAPRAVLSRSAASRHSPEIRATGLIRVLAASFDRPALGLLVRVPAGLSNADLHSLIDGCAWLTQRGPLGIWLADAPATAMDRIGAVTVRLPAELTDLVEVDDLAGLKHAMPQPTVDLPTTWHPPVPGNPHPASRAEKLLESALAGLPWAAGRAWNQSYQPHPLANQVRLDLVWWQKRCVVEVDGPEHRQALHFEADRRRDVQLQIAGYAVLRFTNEQVLDDVLTVITQIERFIRTRLPNMLEVQPNA